ncbi:SDR family NAD(P)-dependent oxidoreductase [Actinospica durhamensis]|uniref:SDR family NAD(P)-dependent oxidoreductase n=1 Tax=Actinospica durhamensis TaxID=1508375 RepID=A0A941ELG2_9ACTN|nr:type I polyketide synthase [Actinospica durhamensis]MBR7833506.1 SDR family NAD(P)-dependent oxidoreductase [Actinospica durhamensis]
MTENIPAEVSGSDIALVGMAGRFPGAADVAGLWTTVRAGRSGLTAFTDEELLAAGVPRDLVADPDYVKSGAVLEGIDRFDAEFFGISPKEAQIIDPQQRLFLEHAWHALEDAGCDPARFDGSIGVFAGSAWSSYLANNLAPAGTVRSMGEIAVALGNDKDTLALRAAHTLGLSGPAFGIQSFCSTSLVAVCVAASSLANFECDMALAGGVVVTVPHRVGYLYQQGGITSPDGECRAFDAAGSGAAMGSGVGVVALRRLADALADGDRVYAVLRGWAVNNDAGHKVGFTAPGVDGQAAVIAEAVAAAGLEPSDIDYIEAHGTGTRLGDAVELAALQRVFDGHRLRIGSVKSNVGHLDRAAGVTGLIKAALALHHGEIPPTRNFTDPNPQLTAGGAELSVVTERQPWPRGERPRRAGVSAFGIGGTNAHVVLEESPRTDRPAAPARPELLVWSARSAAAADEATEALAERLEQTEDDLADIAHTLRLGRAQFQHRRMAVADSPDAAAALLRAGDAYQGTDDGASRPVGFLFTGTDRIDPAVAAQLYADEPAFRAAFDACRESLAAQRADTLGNPLGELTGAVAAFAAGYALGRLVESWGVTPATVLGEGTGAYVAAVLSGSQSLDEAIGQVGRPPETTETRLTIPQTEQPYVYVEFGPALADGNESEESLRIPLLPSSGDAISTRTSILEAAGQLWLAGVALDWAAFQGDRTLRRVDLPLYPFQRSSYWIEAPTQQPEASVQTAKPTQAPVNQVQLLKQTWHVAPSGDTVVDPATCVLVPDIAGVADVLAQRLRENGRDVLTASDAEHLAATVAGLAGTRVTVVDLSPLDRSEPGSDAAAAVRTAGRNLAACAADGSKNADVVVVTRGGQAVADGEAAHSAQAAVATLPVVAGQEHLNVSARCVDLDARYDAARAALALVAELGDASPPALVAHRDGARLAPRYTPVEQRGAASPVRRGGGYLVTGGLGDVGLLVTEHLASGGAGRLVLTSRTGLSNEDPASPRAAAVARLRALGAEVHTPRIDVTDAAAMRELFARHRIDGVVHLAADATLDTFAPLGELDEANVARHFGAKHDGAGVLADVVEALPVGSRPEWCVLFSSTSAFFGGVTLGSYAAANAALGARVHGRQPEGTRWIAAAWDTWPGTVDRLDGPMGATMAARAMTREQALSAFDGVLAQPGAAVIVAVGPLEDRLAPPSAQPAPATRTETRFPRPDLPQPYSPPLTATERALAELWSTVLGVEPVGKHDNFFDLSGNSLLGLQMLALVKKRFGIAVPTVSLFERPTVRALATALDEQTPAPTPVPVPLPTQAPVAPVEVIPPVTPAAPVTPVAHLEPESTDLDPDFERHIAVVGMAGRFPGAGDVATFWRNLCEGVESITFFSPEELAAAGVDPATAADPAYVPARPVLEDIAGFDAGFFGISPRMAAITDPQQRLFLEVCWEALEQSGYCRPEHRGRVGVFGGCNLSTYLLGMAERSESDANLYELVMGNDKDALTTTVSYLFDLTGPSVAVQTFCSTSLVAVHTAVRSLRAGDCEMAIAGGVSVRVPDRVGHLFEAGGQDSPDGHVRTFDAQAQGSLFGDGATAVVLKPLGAALRDGDHIWSVIRGTAMNNDGALKVGYTAPSVAGQSRVVADALVDARVTAEEIGYVEAHGTGTVLGDPIEVAALTRAFGPTERRQYCPIGSVKTNIGHLDRAAGTAGLIKTSLVVKEGLIPATLHYTSPNPEIDFEHSPFYVNDRLASWGGERGVRRIAGLNSLGMGGTNVHVVVEQPPVRPAPAAADAGTRRRYQVLPVSARRAEAADEAVRRLAEHLEARSEQLRLADVAFTLQVGRKTFEHRRVAVADGIGSAVAVLSGDDAGLCARVEATEGRPVAFLFTGVGEQYPGMVGELYRREPVFRAKLDACLSRLADVLAGTDAADLLTGARTNGSGLAALLGREVAADGRTAALQRTEVAQPLMFAVDYALAGTLMEWGIEPTVMLGYSLGEYVAACLSGVLSLDDALALVSRRAQLIGRAEPGVMAAVPLSAEELRERYGLERLGLDIAAVNGPQAVVVAGERKAVDALVEHLREAGIPARELRTTHAFHSRMLAPLADELTGWIVRNVKLNPPTVPYVSNVTGRTATAELVCDPAYWARHMCETVRFADGAATLLAYDEECAVVEIGPGQSLGALLRTAGCPTHRWPLITATLPAEADPRADDAVLPDCLARLWLAGVEVDWATYHGRRPGPGTSAAQADAAPGRIPLPTYPFQRQRFWIDRKPQALPIGGAAGSASAASTAPEHVAQAGSLQAIDAIPLLPEEQWVHVPVWRQKTAAPSGPAPSSWLVFARDGVADAVLDRLREAVRPTGATVTMVRPGAAFEAASEGCVIRPGSIEDTTALIRYLRSGPGLDRVVHLWTVEDGGAAEDSQTPVLGLQTLVALARAAGEIGLESWSLDIVTSGSQRVLDDAEARPYAALVTGPALAIPCEYTSVTTRIIDVDRGAAGASLVAELLRPTATGTVALRGNRRWLRGFEAVEPAPDAELGNVLRERGVYLITGGLGGIGLAMAERLARDCRARLVLFGRQGLPDPARWAAIAAGEDEVSETVRARVARVLEVLEQGGEVEIVAGDVTNAADVRRAVDRARERFGALHGVLHAAGVPGTGLMQFQQPGGSEQVLAPKVAGTLALADALGLAEGASALDFLVLFSSITAVAGGGPGQVDYCAANAFLDAYAAERSALGERVLSVGWGEWTWNAWDGGLSGYDEGVQTFFREHRARFGIGFDQGWRTLLRSLATGEPHVVISTQDLTAILEVAGGFTVDAVAAAAAVPQGVTGRHPRPDLVTVFQEPDGAAEKTIAEAWCQALQLERVGAADNFFELGGTSLLSISLLGVLRRAFPDAELPSHIIHEAPTVAALARIAQGIAARAEQEAAAHDAAAQGELRRSGLRSAARRRRA